MPQIVLMHFDTKNVSVNTAFGLMLVNDSIHLVHRASSLTGIRSSARKKILDAIFSR